MNDFVYLGTKLKYLVTIQSSGFSMDRDDFDITLKRGGVSRTFAKSELVSDGEDYYLVFDTTDFGAGALEASVTARVPDEDFPDGIRTEVHKFRLTTIKS